MLRLDNTKLSVKDSAKLEKRADRLQKELHRDLMTFTQTPVLYAIKRLLAADLKKLYVASDYSTSLDDGITEGNPFWPEFQPAAHPRKGGLQVAEFLVYSW